MEISSRVVAIAALALFTAGCAAIPAPYRERGQMAHARQSGVA